MGSECIVAGSGSLHLRLVRCVWHDYLFGIRLLFCCLSFAILRQLFKLFSLGERSKQNLVAIDNAMNDLKPVEFVFYSAQRGYRFAA